MFRAVGWSANDGRAKERALWPPSCAVQIAYGFLCYSGTGAKATAVGQTALALEQGPTGFGFGLAIPAMDRWCQRRRRVAAPIFVAASCGFAAP